MLSTVALHEPVFLKETKDSPEFLHYPRKYMPQAPDPGGVAHTCRTVHETIAFQQLETVSFRLLHLILSDHDHTYISGLNPAAYILESPSSAPSLREITWVLLPARWLTISWVGIDKSTLSHPLGSNIEFQRTVTLLFQRCELSSARPTCLVVKRT